MPKIGSMRQLDDKHGAVRVEDVYDTDIHDLWSALTEPDRLARWMAEVAGDLRLGSTVQAVFTSTWQVPAGSTCATRRIDCCSPPNPAPRTRA